MTKYILKEDNQPQNEYEYIKYILMDGDEDDQEQQDLRNKKTKAKYMTMQLLEVIYEEEDYEY